MGFNSGFKGLNDLLFLQLAKLVRLRLWHHVTMGFSHFFANSCLE